MKFIITAASIPYRYSNRILDEYPCLKNFGVEIENSNKAVRFLVKDEDGNGIWYKDMEVVQTPYVEIDSIEKLTELISAVGHPVVIGTHYGKGFEIEIYDAWG